MPAKPFPPDEIMDEEARLVRGWASVEIVDEEGQLVPIDKLAGTMDAWMERGAPISDADHSDRIIGKGKAWKVATEPSTGAKGILLDYEVFKNQPYDDVVWTQIKKGVRKGLSWSGGYDATKSRRTQTKGTLAQKLDSLQTFAFASCVSPKNPAALNTNVNFYAASNDKPAEKAVYPTSGPRGQLEAFLLEKLRENGISPADVYYEFRAGSAKLESPKPEVEAKLKQIFGHGFEEKAQKGKDEMDDSDLQGHAQALAQAGKTEQEILAQLKRVSSYPESHLKGLAESAVETVERIRSRKASDDVVTQKAAWQCDDCGKSFPNAEEATKHWKESGHRNMGFATSISMPPSKFEEKGWAGASTEEIEKVSEALANQGKNRKEITDELVKKFPKNQPWYLEAVADASIRFYSNQSKKTEKAGPSKGDLEKRARKMFNQSFYELTPAEQGEVAGSFEGEIVEKSSDNQTAQAVKTGENMEAETPMAPKEDKLDTIIGLLKQLLSRASGEAAKAAPAAKAEGGEGQKEKLPESVGEKVTDTPGPSKSETSKVQLSSDMVDAIKAEAAKAVKESFAAKSEAPRPAMNAPKDVGSMTPSTKSKSQGLAHDIASGKKRFNYRELEDMQRRERDKQVEAQLAGLRSREGE